MREELKVLADDAILVNKWLESLRNQKWDDLKHYTSLLGVGKSSDGKGAPVWPTSRRQFLLNKYIHRKLLVLGGMKVLRDMYIKESMLPAGSLLRQLESKDCVDMVEFLQPRADSRYFGVSNV